MGTYLPCQTNQLQSELSEIYTCLHEEMNNLKIDVFKWLYELFMLKIWH